MSDTTAMTRPDLPPRPERQGLRRYLATSEDPLPVLVRTCHRKLQSLSVPAPSVLAKPLAWLIIHVRAAYHYTIRIFICEPFLKAHCRKYGRNVHAGCYLHWIQGKGDIVLGNDVTIDGRCTIAFAARYSDRPLLQIGDKTGIGHGCAFIIGKRITIGENCTLSGDIRVFDSNGHPTDPAARLAGQPPADDDVRPVTIGNGVWIGQRCLIFPGVRIGQNSVISAGSVVRSHVPPFSVVAGNPAKVMFRLKQPLAADPKD